MLSVCRSTKQDLKQLDANISLKVYSLHVYCKPLQSKRFFLHCKNRVVKLYNFKIARCFVMMTLFANVNKSTRSCYGTWTYSCDCIKTQLVKDEKPISNSISNNFLLCKTRIHHTLI